MKFFNIPSHEHPSPACELLYTEDFRHLRNWNTTQIETVKCSRSQGATLSFHQVDKKNFVSPCIISKAFFEGGCVRIVARLNQNEKIIHYFTLRHKSEEIGFKAINGKLYLIVPHSDIIPVKLFDIAAEHTYEIEIDPENDYIIWRVDNITVYRVRYPSPTDKHVMIGMNAAQGKLNPKELPLSFNLKSVQFFVNEINQLKRRK